MTADLGGQLPGVRSQALRETATAPRVEGLDQSCDGEIAKFRNHREGGDCVSEGESRCIAPGSVLVGASQDTINLRMSNSMQHRSDRSSFRRAPFAVTPRDAVLHALKV